LSDHLLALRALLEPEGPASGLLPGRLAALCATPERRLELTERAIAALELEREVVTGVPAPRAGRSRGARQELARDMADHLRALLRDVICGHLDPDLVALADRLLLESTTDAEASAPGEVSAEEVLGDPGQPQEILDVFI
jgi:hypothetical protein